MSNRLRNVVREAAGLAVVLSLTLIGRAALADQYLVPSGSMEPTIQIGDHIVANKAAFGLRVPLTDRYLVRWGAPQRGEVVVLDSPDEDKVLTKRVAAVSGDVVQVRSGALQINGRAIQLKRVGDQVEELSDAGPHALDMGLGGGPDFGPIQVPKDEVLVLGDNRGNSRDGRYFGFVRDDAVLGRVLGVVWRHGPTWKGF